MSSPRAYSADRGINLDCHPERATVGSGAEGQSSGFPPCYRPLSCSSPSPSCACCFPTTQARPSTSRCTQSPRHAGGARLRRGLLSQHHGFRYASTGSTVVLMSAMGGPHLLSSAPGQYILESSSFGLKIAPISPLRRTQAIESHWMLPAVSRCEMPKRPTFAAFNQGELPTIACFNRATTALGVDCDTLIARQCMPTWTSTSRRCGELQPS